MDSHQRYGCRWCLSYVLGKNLTGRLRQEHLRTKTVGKQTLIPDIRGIYKPWRWNYKPWSHRHLKIRWSFMMCINCSLKLSLFSRLFFPLPHTNTGICCSLRCVNTTAFVGLRCKLYHEWPKLKLIFLSHLEQVAWGRGNGQGNFLNWLAMSEKMLCNHILDNPEDGLSYKRNVGFPVESEGSGLLKTQILSCGQ